MVVILCVVLVLGIAAPAAGQSRSLFDLEGGFGYAFGTGSEDEAPGLGTITAGGTVWPIRGSWGVMLVRVASYGEVLRDPPLVSGDITFLGKTNLRYWRIGARYRRAIGDRSTLTLGLGAALDGWYEHRVRLARGGSSEEHRSRISGGGFAGELYFGHQISPRFHLRLGATLDSSFETTVVQPVALAVVSLW